MRLVGIDGCPDGWIYIVEDATRISAKVARTFSRLIADVGGDAIVAVDIPIGLPAAGSREADLEARRQLKRPRASSVFPAPVRAALGADTYLAACAVHQSVDGRKMTRQAFNILPKIREVDAVLVGSLRLREQVREVHPELCFAIWNAAPMVHRKAMRAGRDERELLIDAAWPGQRERLFATLRQFRCAPHDLNDAFAALWTARRIRDGVARVFPAAPPLDDAGLRMGIVA